MSNDKKLNELKNSFKDKTPKQMRTIRNNLNNRMRSFEEELRYGKALPNITHSHMFYGLEYKDLKELHEFTMKRIRLDVKSANAVDGDDE